MKSSILIAALGLGLSNANAQKLKTADVPQAVRSSFEKHYAAVKDAKWEKENGNYEVAFINNKVSTSLLIDKAGTLIETEQAIPEAALPKKVKEYLSKNLPGKKIKEAAKITNAKGIVCFEAEVGGADYLFDEKGDLIKKVVEK